MLIRPLVHRELLRECRHRSHFVLRTLFLVALGLVIAYIWINLISLSAYSASSAQIAAARYGTTLFLTWAAVQLIAVCLLSTVRAASLADERRVGSLPLIRSTAMGDGSIVIGWFLSVMGRALFTMVLTTPVLVICSGFGGFTVSQVMAVCWLTLVAAMTTTALTLAWASVVRNTSTAIAASMMMQIAGIIVAEWSVGEIVGRECSWISASTLFPYVTFKDYAPRMFGRVNPIKFMIEGLTLLTASRLVAATAFLFFAFWRLKKPAPRMGRALKAWLVRMDRFFLRMSKGKQILWRAGLGPCRGNPVLWRERAVSLIGQRDHLIRIGYISMLLVVGLAAIPILFLLLILVISPAMTFPKERQKKALDLLAVTPLSPRQIVMGKYFFSIRGLMIPLILVLLMMLIAGVTVGIEPEIICLILAPFVLGLLVIAATLYVGAASRTPIPAIAGGLAILAAVFVTMMPGVLDELFSFRYYGLQRMGLRLLVQGGGFLFLIWMIWRIIRAVKGRPQQPGALGRTVWALLLIILAGLFLHAFGLSDYNMSYRNRDPWKAIASFMALSCVSMAGISIFLSAAQRKLDVLIGRNG